MYWRHDRNAVWNLLLHAGYLTCVARSPTAHRQITVDFPNEEVKKVSIIKSLVNG